MHSVTLDRSVSPKKRTLSRGMSEDESLRIIIKETESSSRRLTRSDSRGGTLKRSTDSQQSDQDQDLYLELPEMLELQASYDEVVQELRGLEVEREALLFQVDVLQDTLEGVEELLAETQREAGQASMELRREREAKRKYENMVCSLTQEVERLKEERSNVPVNTLVGQQGSEDMAMGQRSQMKKDAKEHIQDVHREDKNSLGAPLSTTPLDGIPAENQSSDTSTRGLPASEEVGKGEVAEDEGSPLMKLQNMGNKTLGQMPTLALDSPLSEDGVLRRPCENHIEDGRDPSPDRNNDTDSISAYEDASADTPEVDKVFPGALGVDALELPDDAGTAVEEEESNCSEPQNPRSTDFCSLS